ncbi:hypothetical protein VOLCADRAFT_100624 [Volvox carteri f. nagariensis]|uniref:Uncharacterized protein n=1 Tax=Volvox carteri f. nagariensis TaxID=3068 RepID=D8UKN6_VOLCA|nr:uncharacterized protein VOLCADRAFT_100624 [Volvox carteri f. nagariensis]EFJ39710.1 hypothetical protein VOLCADRAFT_100624 [Volvox carteri f. nagariensis]|eukprot:XP_002959217.1 hypothetical protein VOLCADRAFT_100624 [Volvox carteri f. nagariensis]
MNNNCNLIAQGHFTNGSQPITFVYTKTQQTFMHPCRAICSTFFECYKMMIDMNIKHVHTYKFFNGRSTGVGCNKLFNLTALIECVSQIECRSCMHVPAPNMATTTKKRLTPLASYSHHVTSMTT